MTVSEFKAWFSGYAENIEGVPSLEQWKRVVERVAEVSPALPNPVCPAPNIQWPTTITSPYLGTTGGTFCQ